ncbi:TPA: restriction endonuclease, partial [Acinetobacter baumannii]|nr:restriction endonuclease [Acinetobacter baumannii]
WRSYTIRLIRWLELTGFLQPATEPNTWIYKDLGSPKTSVMSRRRTSNFFVPRITPQLFISIYPQIAGKNLQELINDGRTNKALEILKKFELIDNEFILDIKDFESVVYAKANSEFSIQAMLEIKELYSADKLSGQALGKLLKEKYDLKWTDVTTQYSGNKLNSWAKWVKSYEVKNE